MSHRITFYYRTGNPEFSRFVIAESQGGVWNGQAWTADVADAQLYANPRHASTDCADLQRRETLNKPHRVTAKIPVIIEAFSDQPLDPEAVKVWLIDVLNLRIDFRSGSGPTEDSIVLATLVFEDWVDTKPDLGTEKKGKP